MSSFEGHAKGIMVISEQDVTVYRHGNGYGKVNSFLNITLILMPGGLAFSWIRRGIYHIRNFSRIYDRKQHVIERSR